VRYSFFVHSVFSLWAYSPISHFTVNLSSYGGFSEDSLGLCLTRISITQLLIFSADCSIDQCFFFFFFIERNHCWMLFTVTSFFYFLFFLDPEGLNTSLREWYVGGRDCLGHKRFHFKNLIYVFYQCYSPSWTVTLALL